jgi:hypothetical protein
MGINNLTKVRIKLRNSNLVNILKRFYVLGLYVRGIALKIVGKKSVTNLYHFTTQKSGSQWFRSVFEDPEIQRITGLKVFPQYRYEWEGGYQKFPQKTYVPGLYLPYNSLHEISKPDNYKVLFVYRNPLDIVESWYYSMKYSHKPKGQVPIHRENLQNMNGHEALYYCIDNLAVPFSYMKSWFVDSIEKENIIYIKFERLKVDSKTVLEDILHAIDVDFDPGLISKLANDYSKEDMNKLYNSSEKYNHYRTSDEKEVVFTKEHLTYFKKINGDILERMGYSDDISV